MTYGDIDSSLFNCISADHPFSSASHSSHSERVTLESHLSRQEEEISTLEAKLKKASATSQHNQKASHESHLMFEEVE